VNGHTYKKIEKQLLFVRHAEGYHNSLFDEKRVHEAVNIRDPELTPLGNCQVADLRKEVINNFIFRDIKDRAVLSAFPIKKS
jgi:broad specificity phosphatase PhoE